ncbi:GldG family protein [Anaerosacchariphilus polymeriproducens]|uniref:ABC transporter n=1 Tax=Anaerosacchariphilus polymeriproducens TaxID=1812858 RepID=A0A371AW41_9FIRM|nr:GldG family protein [Anaerosacchariphilus polymeriproducens]RDU23759.1 ABC transporter [Anaerosacchariphilus polymeriproducens]
MIFKKDMFQTKKFKNGSYSTLLAVIAIAMVIVLNLIVNAIPANYTKFDVSTQKLTKISKQTKEILSNLSEDVTIYQITQQKNKDKTISALLERYKAGSSRIKIEEIDPATNPNFASNYTSDTLKENSVIIKSEKRSKVIPYDSIYASSMDSATYQQTTSFDGEGQITSGVDYVTTNDLPVVYELEGHGETKLSAAYISAIEKQNISVKSVNLVTSETLPKDCDCLFIMAPKQDLTESELKKINAYLEKGGNIFIASGYEKTDLKNLESILGSYQMKVKDGLIVENDNSHFVNQYPYYLVPDLTEHKVTSDLISENLRVIVPESRAIELVESKDKNISTTSLLTTSDKAYKKVLEGNDTSLVQEDSDETGTFNVAAAATKKLKDKESHLIYLASSKFFVDDINQLVAGANEDFAINGLSWMCEHESGIAIHSKSLDTQKLVLSAGQVNFWSLLLMIVIPITVIIAGIVVWLRRRRK